jgi:hypothetical protein
MLKTLKHFGRFLSVGLIFAFILGCGGTLSNSPGGISADKYSREASDRFPDPFLGQSGQSAPKESETSK